MFNIYFPVVVAIASLFFVWYLVRHIRKSPSGTSQMAEISQAIKQGSNAFLKRQYKTIAIVTVLLAIALLLGYGFAKGWIMGIQMSTAFLFGAFCSGLAGIVGMWISVQANLKTAAAAQNGLGKALTIALRGGAVSGITIVAMSLIGISGLYLIYTAIGYEAAQRAVAPYGIVGPQRAIEVATTVGLDAA